MLGKKNTGFTLIELLVVIGVMVILSTIVIIAMNPGEKLIDARNNQRKAHVEAIYGAVKSYNFREGKFPDCVGEIAEDVISCESYLVPEHIVTIPQDPLEESINQTGYHIKRNSRGDDVGVRAVDAENGKEIIAGFWD